MANKKHKTLSRLLVLLLALIIILASALTYAYADGTDTPPEPPSGDMGQEPPGGFGGGPGGTPPDGAGNPGQEPPGGFGGGPGGAGGPSEMSAADITYTGVTEFTSDTREEGQTYSSTESDVQALLVTAGNSAVTKATVTKTGDSDGDDSDFYGTNAAVLVTGGSLDISDSDITTDGAHANAVFAYGDGAITISDSTINTTSNNSGAVMVTGGGTLTANDLTVNTKGNSSAPIRSDRGGGTMTINGGTYESNGIGSPVVYSTADVYVNGAEMISTASEGVVVEGKNSVTLNNVTLTADNNTHNGKSETYKAIFLYQSMSGDAEEGTADFTAKDSVINVLNGDTIFVTNTTANVTLENNEINNESGDLLRIQTGAWGNEGSNGGHVTAVLTNQKVDGDIIVDSISTLDLTLQSGSVLTGAIDTDDQARQLDLTMTADSVLVLTGDTYLDSLTNEDAENSNIYLNGCKLYVAGSETAANEGSYAESGETSEDEAAEGSTSSNVAPYVVGVIVLAAVVAGAAVLSRKKKAAEAVTPEDAGAEAGAEVEAEAGTDAGAEADAELDTQADAEVDTQAEQE